MKTKKITVKRLQIANGPGLHERPVYKLAGEPAIRIVPDGVTIVTKMVMVPQRVIIFEGHLYAEVVDDA